MNLQDIQIYLADLLIIIGVGALNIGILCVTALFVNWTYKFIKSN
jgi:uncharacterized membrane protein